MRVLFAMTYYRPYVSGPIVYVENLGRELVRRGHQVTILTSAHDRDLPLDEMDGGIRVVRSRVVARLSKGVIAPGLAWRAHRLARTHDAVVVQIPQLEAPILAMIGRRLDRPVFLTYHCDVQLRAGLANRLIGRVLDTGHRVAAGRADAIAAYTRDYAEHSRVLCRYLDRVTVIRPPVDIPIATDAEAADFRRRHGLGSSPIVGICARLSEEKGFDRLIDALPSLARVWPDLHVVHAGETAAVAGESRYRDHIAARLEPWRDRWIDAGVLGGRDLAAFYAACDVTVLPSVNSTEAYGLVQVESMRNGTPVVASELPGVRVPILESGMGVLVPPSGSEVLAEAIGKVLADPAAYVAPAEATAALGSVERAADGYEAMFAASRGRGRREYAPGPWPEP